MDDKTIERLMRYLGLAYHRATDDITPNGEWRMCACGFAYIRPERHVNRTFTTWDDLGALKDKLVEKGEWAAFDSWACIYQRNELGHWPYDHELTDWLINPSRFCNLVGEWLNGRG